jgi:hypothetical protein
MLENHKYMKYNPFNNRQKENKKDTNIGPKPTISASGKLLKKFIITFIIE